MGLTNYCTNPNFTGDLNGDGIANGWSRYQAPVGSVSYGLSAYGDGYAQRYFLTGGASEKTVNGLQVYDGVGLSVTPVAGEVYTLSFLAKADSLVGCTIAARLQASDSSLGYLAQSATAYISSSSWSRYTTTLTMPAGTAHIGCYFISTTLHESDVFDFSIAQVVLAKSSADPGYFSGSCRGIWTGTANASTSILVPHPLLLRGAE